MEWLKKLHGHTVGLDTAPLIYFMEEHPAYIDATVCFFEAMDEGAFKVVTSTVTLVEVLVHPLRSKNTQLAAEYRDILTNSKLITVEVSRAIAEQAARIRASYNMRTPDAIQMAAALSAEATFFFTNDIRLPNIPSIRNLTLDSLL